MKAEHISFHLVASLVLYEEFPLKWNYSSSMTQTCLQLYIVSQLISRHTKTLGFTLFLSIFTLFPSNFLHSHIFKGYNETRMSVFGDIVIYELMGVANIIIGEMAMNCSGKFIIKAHKYELHLHSSPLYSSWRRKI